MPWVVMTQVCACPSPPSCIELYVMYVALGQWLCEVERFDPVTNQWSLIEPMNHSRTGVAVTALKGTCTQGGGYVLEEGMFNRALYDVSYNRRVCYIRVCFLIIR